jgi:type II secretory pathway pseudopilin PulG
MVMSIVGILATLTIPRFQAYYEIKFSGAMKKVVQDIRYVQQIAVATHDDYRIDFSPGFDRYEVRRVSDNSYAKNPFGKDDFIINFTNDPRYQGIDLDSASFGNSGSSLRFNWEGSPQDATGANLVADGVAAFSYKDSSAAIHVKPNTGFVTLE